MDITFIHMIPLLLFLQTCEAAFATKDRLRAHTVRHEEKVPCHVCGKMLSAAYITDHMKVHSQGPNHVCELCSKGKRIGLRWVIFELNCKYKYYSF